jgi:prephenate dehydratase
MSRIESRPTKRSLGEYLFFVDIEATLADPSTCSMLNDLIAHTETLKIFGSYSISRAEDWMTMDEN